MKPIRLMAILAATTALSLSSVAEADHLNIKDFRMGLSEEGRLGDVRLRAAYFFACGLLIRANTCGTFLALLNSAGLTSLK